MIAAGPCRQRSEEGHVRLYASAHMRFASDMSEIFKGAHLV